MFIISTWAARTIGLKYANSGAGGLQRISRRLDFSTVWNGAAHDRGHPTRSVARRHRRKEWETHDQVTAARDRSLREFAAKLRADYLGIKGKDVTGFSGNEVAAAKRDSAVPFSLEEELKRRGARQARHSFPLHPML